MVLDHVRFFFVLTVFSGGVCTLRAGLKNHVGSVSELDDYVEQSGS